jgi:hypothetical protein
VLAVAMQHARVEFILVYHRSLHNGVLRSSA